MSEMRKAPTWAPGFVHLTVGEEPIPFGFREEMEDFVVEEVPWREPEGHGEHCWILVEKRGVSTAEAVRRLARRLVRNPRDLGFAGRKDARAVARQWISAPGVEPITARGAELGHVRVLAAEKATRRLRLGALAGNRFKLFLRRFPAEAEASARRILATISERGMPNWFGPQRFGFSGRGHELGKLLLAREFRAYIQMMCSPGHAPYTDVSKELHRRVTEATRASHKSCGSLGRELDADLADVARQLARRPLDWESATRSLALPLRSLHLSSYQALLFNEILGKRLAHYDSVRTGDVMWKHENGACFVAEEGDEALEARVAKKEISASGPLYGHKLLMGTGEPLAEELEILEREGLELKGLKGVRPVPDLSGARRALRVPVSELQFEIVEGGARLEFFLPAGAYATSLVEELRKDLWMNTTPDARPRLSMEAKGSGDGDAAESSSE